MTATDPFYKLSAIVLVGSQRSRAQRSVDALNLQTVSKEMEVIIVDTRSERFSQLNMSGEAKHIYLCMPETTTWGEGRYEGILNASAPIVAFIEDHCFADHNWAESLIKAYKNPWASVGYGFRNANPRSYLSRVGMFLDYGLWELPTTSRKVKILPGNNVSYHRETILQFGGRLQQLLEIDFNLQMNLLKNNKLLYTAADAKVSHQNFEYLSGGIFANFSYARVLAFNRAQINSWSFFKRLIYACGTPFVSPPIRLLRLIKSFHFNPDKKKQVINLIKSLPVLVITFICTGIGEAIGYIAGEGQSRAKLFFWEVEAQRLKHPDAS